MYELMARITACDKMSTAEVSAGRLKAAVYPVRGLEAVCAGLGLALRRTDGLVSTYRNLGDAIAKGVPMRAMIAEACGRVTGTSKGKGGAMHLADTAAGLMATTGVVGSGVPIAVGLALANQLDGGDDVTATTFGDGATSIGAFHEAMNMAALWKLPLVLVCQNNGWGEHTPLAEYAGNPDLAARARAYGMHAVTVDGFDAAAVRTTMVEAVERARTDGPVFVEAITYRLAPHSGAGDMSYMPKEALAAAFEREPTPALRRSLIAEGLLTEEETAAIDDRAKAEVEDAFAFAYASEFPSQDEIRTDVFAVLEGVPS